MMVLAVIHGLRPNQKLKSILEGCTDLTHLWGSTLHAHNLFSRPFFPSQSVYIRFTHIVNMQPKFYRGSAMHHTLVGSTVVPESTFNSPMNDLYKLSSHCATGENTTTCTFGHLSQSTQNVPTIAVLKWPSSKNSNPDSTQLSFHLSILPPQERHPQKPALNTNAQFGLPRFGDVPNTNSLQPWSVKF